jgi:hypothetical protein
MTISHLRLQSALVECERHIYHLFHALTITQNFSPLTSHSFQTLSDSQIQVIDQFILRFSKLQDAMGHRLFPALLQYLGESFEERPMIDKLNHLEKFGFIEKAEQWLELRNIRNKFSLDYPDNPEKNAELLNLAFQVAIELKAIFTRIKDKLSIIEN